MIESIANALKSEIDATSLFDSAATVAYVPKVSQEELDAGINVTIVPKSVAEERASRYTWDSEWQVDVAIQRAVTSDTTTVNSELVGELLGKGKLMRNALKKCANRFAGAVLTKIGTPALWIPDHLKRGVFTSVVTVTFEAEDDFTDD